jgi:hypothetical protein
MVCCGSAKNWGPRLLYKDVCCHAPENGHPCRIVTMWLWDPARSEHYYYSPEENAYVYQSGARIPAVSNRNVVVTDTQQYELFVVNL